MSESQKTPPANWTVEPLSEIADVIVSNVDKKTVPGESPVRLCNYTDVYDNDDITPQMSFMEASASQTEIAKFGLRSGDIIITKDSETPNDIGVPAVVRSDMDNVVCGYHLSIIRLKSDDNDPVFLARQIASPRVARYFGRQANGTTRYGLNIDPVEATEIWLAPPDEQRRIALILDTADAAIAKTEALIAKLKQLKAGLLHDLLTRGIDENGELRGLSPESFDSAPWGSIPKGWNRCKLHDVYGEPPRNGLYKKKTYYGSGPRMIHMPQMFRGPNVDCSDAARVSVTASELDRFEIQVGDLLFARRSLTLEGAGKCSMVSQLDGPATFESSIIRIRLDNGKVRPAFVNHFLNTEAGYRVRLPFIRQVAVSGVSSSDIGEFEIPVPTEIDEQDEILIRLSRHQQLIADEEANVDKMRLIKAGMMNDLLTGKKPVFAEAVAAN